MALAERLDQALQQMPPGYREGRVSACNGLVIEAEGPDVHLGEICELQGRGTHLTCQAIGLRDGRVVLMPYGSVAGVRLGDVLRARGEDLRIPVGDALLGRIVDAFGVPIDGGGPVESVDEWPVMRPAIDPLSRQDNDTLLETGVRAIDSLLTIGKGQRIGVFAGSGVGKSTLLGMLARHVRADVTVVGLIGERGREVGDFVHNILGAEGMSRSVVVAATSDQPPLIRAHATHSAHAIAEYFRDQGKDVLLIVDSVTRFAMAQREIGLAAGEPPTSRGYPPSVFNTLPLLVERGGNIRGKGSVTCVYSVLVEGDDMNDPVADHMRALLDGHVVLSREAANRGQWPAIDVLQSVSRWLGRVTTPVERAWIERVRTLLSTFEASRDLVDMGAHRRGINPILDEAVDKVPGIYRLLRQEPASASDRATVYRELLEALDGEKVV